MKLSEASPAKLITEAERLIGLISKDLCPYDEGCPECNRNRKRLKRLFSIVREIDIRFGYQSIRGKQ